MNLIDLIAYAVVLSFAALSATSVATWVWLSLRSPLQRRRHLDRDADDRVSLLPCCNA